MTDEASLFNWGKFRLHSGQLSDWKIDCDHLRQSDWDALAALAIGILPSFKKVVAVPSGGDAFAKALDKYCKKDSDRFLIADDVLTTGISMDDMANDYKGSPLAGIVVFARRVPPLWVTALFTVDQRLFVETTR